MIWFSPLFKLPAHCASEDGDSLGAGQGAEDNLQGYPCSVVNLLMNFKETQTSGSQVSQNADAGMQYPQGITQILD